MYAYHNAAQLCGIVSSAVLIVIGYHLRMIHTGIFGVNRKDVAVAAAAAKDEQLAVRATAYGTLEQKLLITSQE
jgi:hypothetical protein